MINDGYDAAIAEKPTEQLYIPIFMDARGKRRDIAGIHGSHRECRYGGSLCGKPSPPRFYG